MSPSPFLFLNTSQSAPMPIKQTIYTGKQKQSWPSEFTIPLIPPVRGKLLLGYLLAINEW
ncbi:hypothetical protein CROQUDRAFT_92532 [Cronartium quercuum f. sp. fusiforme G11]|uniref:Uncharacterized protein n=1 Tax=Cronartium quercuum f. sp. fusiforme G11 TaxID=708437 RepID=A0A9P6TBR9_9BASI|nr:hypothetical protein CROQUDRAFT_92532 [Cronartium quercuum f. sp. fusiforme G11]